GCCMSMTLRDYARIGLFMLGGGKINGKDTFPPGWVEAATKNELPEAPAAAPAEPKADAKAAPKTKAPAKSKTAAKADASPAPKYGYFWWIGDPPNYSALGIFGQAIAVYPNDHLVIAVNSAWPKATDKKFSEANNALAEAIRAAAK